MGNGGWSFSTGWWNTKQSVLNELQRKIGTITYKTLSAQLKEMEADGLVLRKEYPQIPPKVEYSLSDKGRSLLPIMEAMCQWGLDHSGRSLLAIPETTGVPGFFCGLIFPVARFPLKGTANPRILKVPFEKLQFIHIPAGELAIIKKGEAFAP